jgi:UDP-N-acetylglucosamine--N-acetylmuramyl-(pentapeptide) pyrophosphoryl-undecaprenol N-acetylglucosamine transferase
MRGPAVKPVVIAAGGTGGHFFPAEALAAELFARGHRVVLMTDARSAALNSRVFAGREQFVLRGAGIAGRGMVRASRAIMGLAAGTVQARGILRRIDPAAIVGFGGYPCVAPVLAARTLRHRPVIILHEQNGVLGRANRLLSRYANIVALGVGGTSRIPPGVATELTGNPVRPAIAALAGRGYTPPQESIRLLVLGGSLGARIFSDVVPAAIAELPEDFRARMSVAQQCRAEDISRVSGIYQQAGIAAELAPFFDDVAVKLDAAHLLIARAGASTCAEIATVGRPAILVPLPSAIDDHQTANAQALGRAGGARVITQKDFTPGTLAAQLKDFFARPHLLVRAAGAAAALGRPASAAALADLVERQVVFGEARA